MNNFSRVLIAATVCVALVACTKKVKESNNDSSDSSNNGAITEGMAGDGTYGPGDLDTDACLRQRVVYFDFDQDNLRPEFQAIIACHAKYLMDRPDARMTLQGNTDERGTREYNHALGERRGNAVSGALLASGGGAQQLNVSSYGEEQPVCDESNESCWSKNRRVEIYYTSK